MPCLLRPKRTPEEKPPMREAICMCGFQILGIGASPVARGMVLPCDDARVQSFPEHFRELGRPMTEVVLSDGK